MVSKMKIKRIAEGRTQAKLGKLTGLRQERISLIERGISPMNDEAQKIADALNTTVKRLFPGILVNFKG